MRIKHFIILALVITAAATGCRKEKFDINQNPNNATDSTIVYNLILPAAQNNTARLVARNWGWLQNYLGYWARSGTYAPNVAEETYQLTTSFQNGIWSGAYDNLYDYQAMLNEAKKANAGFYVGIARIMKAHNYAILVDVYNNVPYFQALQGNNNITPKYDKGSDIYKDLLRQLDTAITDIKTADILATGPNKSIATDDIMFGNKLFPASTITSMKPRWVKFANTLKLRLLVHLMNGGVVGTGVGTPQSVVAGFDIPAEIAKINATGDGFLATGLDAQVQPGYASDKGNPFYNLYVADNGGTATANSVYYKANEYAIGYYNGNGDPRLTKFYTAVGGAYRGVKYGLPSLTSNAAATLSGIGAGVYRGVDQPQWIMTAVESYMLQAEAMHRGFLAGDAKTTLTTGIRESFTMLGLTVAQANAYISDNVTWPDVDYSAPSRGAGKAAGGLFTIISQKWFALNGIAPYEVWTDYRRVDFSPTVNHFVYGTSVDYQAGPPLSVSPANTATQIPIRLPYPQTEYNYNPSNVGSEGTINVFTSRIFWDLF